MSRTPSTPSSNAAAAVAATEVSFNCAGTPSAPDDSVALGAVESVTEAIGSAVRNKSGSQVRLDAFNGAAGNSRDCVIPLLEHCSDRRLGDRLRYYSTPEFLR